MWKPLLARTAQEIGFTLIHGSAVSDTKVIPMTLPVNFKLPVEVDVSTYIAVMNMDSDDAISFLAKNPDIRNGRTREKAHEMYAAYMNTLGVHLQSLGTSSRRFALVQHPTSSPGLSPVCCQPGSE
jgi:hypothetical protein